MMTEKTESSKTATETVVLTRRTISPYDLSPSDNPGCVISQPLLRGSNYDEWSANIRLALMARKKFGFVDGTIPKPDENSADLEDWRCNNALVVSWIKLTVESSLRTTLHSVDVSRDLWEHIQKRFSVKSGAKIGRIKAELATARQNGKSVEAYFGYMTQLWTTFNDYRRPKTCRCGLCTCNLGTEIAKEREEDRVYKFVRGLDDSYGQLRSALISRVPFPSLDDVYLALTQEEDSRLAVVPHDNRTDGVSFAAQSMPRPRNPVNDKTRLVTGVCKSCGRTGHTAEQCFRTIGYPPWWGDRPRNRDSPAPNPRNRASSSAHAAVTTNQGTTHTANAVINGEDRVGLVGLSDAKWKGLIKMLEERKLDGEPRLSGNSFSESWIYDTGASNHMTGSVKYLDKISVMAPVLIKLPDGRFSVAKQKGCVKLGAQLVLQNVFYVDGPHHEDPDWSG
ncbi:hypothetical protein V5N11_004448 [Cardamine amara subsp. amara]|uniref:CCHC-type domain-containing protein n=1 Tax=Cardamine amara subsp. amara TaxID=228776 RepID=A0ABD1BZQ3_CARAN